METLAVGVLALVGLLVMPRLTVTVAAFIINPLLGCAMGLLMLMTLD
jgi:hypothetical protein